MDSQHRPILVTEPRASQILAVSVRHLFNLRKTGRLVGIDVGTGSRPAIRYRLADLERFAAAKEGGK